MSTRSFAIKDGNEAAAAVAYRASEIIAIYPITPSSSMGELSDEWAAKGQPNLWGQVPTVVEMQSEGGAAGAVHGALQGGALATTFTASQGLLLMIPNMYKIAGELTPFVMHVAARTVATHALSIFGDHSDVMACRQTGFAMLCANSVQEAHDFAAVAHAATLRSRVPFMHFFDGFRTSHELARIELLADDDLRAMLDDDAVAAHRSRALSPEHPVVRGTAQNPDTFFQAREACNSWYDACPGHVEDAFALLAERSGRSYQLYEYVGHAEAERVVVMMGSGAEAAHAWVDWATARGERVGLLKVRLYRPFAMDRFVSALPASVQRIAVLDRTKEPGAPADPLYLDVVASLAEARAEGQMKAEPVVVAGRYGLSSKEFTPAHVGAIFQELSAPRPRRRFTVGIVDDVTHLSLPTPEPLHIEPASVLGAVFYGLGADGTVSANKSSIKIIGEETDNYVQGYFVYDSKKSGAVTISHLRFGPDPIRASWLVDRARFVACHQWNFVERFDITEYAADGAVLLLNAPFPSDQVWDRLPLELQRSIQAKNLQLWSIDGTRVARDTGMGGRINTIMQTCFFAISGVLPQEEAIERIKTSIQASYGKRGEELIQRNFDAVDATVARLERVAVPATISATWSRPPAVSRDAPDHVQRVSGLMLAGKGDLLPVSAFPVDGTWPTGTSKWEKRSIALEIPLWDPAVCIQCNKCAMVCPHAAIRATLAAPAALEGAPEGFRAVPWKDKDAGGLQYILQVAPEDCTGCGICVQVCPAKDRTNPRHKAIDMMPQPPLREQERENYAYFLDLPDVDRAAMKTDIRGVQFLQPLFEYSGACAGCGETPYIKLLTQLYGDHLIIANATGCSSIYGGNLPTTPYTTNRDGRGPAWANSLFEDNAEFGLGIRLAVEHLHTEARSLVGQQSGRLGDVVTDALLVLKPNNEAERATLRAAVVALRERLRGDPDPVARRLLLLADELVPHSVWTVGGDGWAYDIGFGGLDHVLASGRDVNLLVLDTEVYSNTGGQASKATPMGAAARFAVAGKATGKKDLALIAMTYGNVYVARIAFGAKDTQTVKAIQEAEAYPGPSLVLAFSPCIAHGYDLSQSAVHQKAAVDSGAWPLFRFDPRRAAEGKSRLELDSAPPKLALEQYTHQEARFRMVEQRDPARYRALIQQAQTEVRERYALYQRFIDPVSPSASAPPTEQK